ncbi:hypothetical protein [Paenibacillus woosongensis]|uniref:Uncharacterized protein n=1 Tax=Paenibacillus woosongensis TaxID=307580 RepID=A0A7X2Z2H6_9BACL|nr:hypothetical protein [Paenibacillus woosongensis]MUG46323.1 hypothetical protein [Paenibacillus woosongensis]
MIEEFKYNNEFISGITSLTMKKEDILKLHDEMITIFRAYKPRVKYSIITNSTRNSFSDPHNIDFFKIKEPIKAIIIEYNIQRIIDVEIYLSTYEKGEGLGGFRSVYRISSNNEELLAKVRDFIEIYIKKTKNLHFIFHKYAVFVSLALTGGFIYFLNKYIEIPQALIYLLIMVMPFYVFTKFFRWLMPYTYIVDENKLKYNLRYIVATVMVGMITSGAYDFIKNTIGNMSK